MKTVVDKPTFQLRDFQESLIADWTTSSQNRTIVAANCGAGKTIIGGAMARATRDQKKRTLFCFDLKCLPLQAANDIARLGLRVGIFAAGHPAPRGDEDVVLVMLQTLEARLRRGSLNLDALFGENIGLVIFDEVHDLVLRRGFAYVREYYADTKHVGLTATPYRLKPQEYLGKWFDQVLPAPQPGELIRRGFILPERVFTPKLILQEDQLALGSDGDYSTASQEKEVLKQTSLDSVIEAWDRICPGIPAACYAASLPHARALSEAFNRFFNANRDRYPEAIAQWQCGDTPPEERAAQFDDMRRGRTLVICSVGTLTKGFDLDCIGAILFVRATKSRALYMQCAGRGCRIQKRPHPAYPEGKKWYYLLAFSNVVDRFGAPSDYQDYSISEPTDRPQIEYRKTCPECGHQCLRTAKQCDHCGYIWVDEGGQAIAETEYQKVELEERLTSEGRRAIKLLKRARLEAFVGGLPMPDSVPGVPVVPEAWYRGLVFGKFPGSADIQLFREHLVSVGHSPTAIAIEMRREFGEQA